MPGPTDEIVHNGRVNHLSIAVYLRVSTSRQDLRSQEPELQSWLQTHAADRPVVWYRDRHTVRSLDRPALYGHLNPYRKYRFDLDEDLHGAALRPLRTPGDDP